MIQSNYPQGYVGNVAPVLSSQQSSDVKPVDVVASAPVQVSVSKPTSELEQIDREISKTEAALKSVPESSRDYLLSHLQDLRQARSDLITTGNAYTTQLERINSPSQNTVFVSSGNVSSASNVQGFSVAPSKVGEFIQNLPSGYSSSTNLFVSNYSNAPPNTIRPGQPLFLEVTPQGVNPNILTAPTTAAYSNVVLPPSGVSNFFVPYSPSSGSLMPLSTVEPTSKAFASNPLSSVIGSTPLYDVSKSFDVSGQGVSPTVSAIVGLNYFPVTRIAIPIIQEVGHIALDVSGAVSPIRLGGGYEVSSTGQAIVPSQVTSQAPIQEYYNVVLLGKASALTTGGSLTRSALTIVGLGSSVSSELSNPSLENVVYISLFATGIPETKSNVVSGLNYNRFSSVDILGGTIRETPSIVTSNIRGREFLKSEGISVNTFDTLETPLSQLSVSKSNVYTYSSLGEKLVIPYEKPVEVSFGEYPKRVETITILDLNKPTSSIVRIMPEKMFLNEVVVHPFESNRLTISEEFSQVKYPSREQISLYSPNQLGYRNLIELESNLIVSGESSIASGIPSYNAIVSYRPTLYEFGAVTVEKLPEVVTPKFKGSNKPFVYGKPEISNPENFVNNNWDEVVVSNDRVSTVSEPQFNVLGNGRVSLGGSTTLIYDEQALPSQESLNKVFGSNADAFEQPSLATGKSFVRGLSISNIQSSSLSSNNILGESPSVSKILDIAKIQSQQNVQIQVQRQPQEQLKLQVQIQQQQQVQLQEQVQVQEVELVSVKSPVRSEFRFNESSINPPPETRKNLPLAKPFVSSKGKSLRVEVRKRGKFQLVGSASSESEALSLGEKAVESSASASFRIKSEEGGVLSLPIPKGYVAAKSERGVIVQPREKRISSFGEKQEITFKGIEMNRVKGLRNQKFGGRFL